MSDEKHKRWYDLFMSGKTYGEIASEDNTSRSAVAGAIDRFRKKYGLLIQRDRIPRNLKGKTRRKMEPVRVAEITPFHFTLAQLSHDECRFPYGDEQYTFCGHKRAPGSSYCPTHQALCRRKVPKKSGVLESIVFEPWKSAKANEASRRART